MSVVKHLIDLALLYPTITLDSGVLPPLLTLSAPSRAIFQLLGLSGLNWWVSFASDFQCPRTNIYLCAVGELEHHRAWREKDGYLPTSNLYMTIPL